MFKIKIIRIEESSDCPKLKVKYNHYDPIAVPFDSFDKAKDHLTRTFKNICKIVAGAREQVYYDLLDFDDENQTAEGRIKYKLNEDLDVMLKLRMYRERV